MPNKTCGEVLREAAAVLMQSGVPDAAFDTRCLLAHCMGCSLSSLRLRAAECVPDGVRERFDALVCRRASGEPLQYILGEWDFYDRTFTVQQGVLIPRPETEFLVDEAVRLLPEDGVLYDVCAGTGCIGLSVAGRRQDAQVYLFEKYDDAYAVLLDNMERHALPNAHAVQRDMFLGAPDGVPSPDGIVSNPPYIKTDELPALQREVHCEPRQALDGGADGLALNPLAHLDLWGCLLILLVGFGYAKPVPVNMRNFKNPKAGMALVALAGPLSNLIMAFLFLILRAVAIVFISGSFSEVLQFFFYYAAYINISLAVFNILPIPPLDGSRLATALLPNDVYYKIMQYERYIMIVLFVLLLTGALSTPLSWLSNALLRLINSIAVLPFKAMLG